MGLPTIAGCDSFSSTIVTSLPGCVPEKVGGGGAVVSDVQVYEVPLLTLPAGSSAQTVKVCDPSASTPLVNGLVHVDDTRSTVHWNVTPGCESVKENVPVLELVSVGGWSVIAGAGGGVPPGMICAIVFTVTPAGAAFGCSAARSQSRNWPSTASSIGP